MLRVYEKTQEKMNIYSKESQYYIEMVLIYKINGLNNKQQILSILFDFFNQKFPNTK